MYHTISNINKTINLQQYIDNRDGNKRIGLKSITYGVDWFNVLDEHIRKIGRGSTKIADGYYSFQQISDEFKKENIDLSVNEANGIATLTTPIQLKMSKGLKKMLGLTGKREFEPNQTHVGNKSVDFAIHKSLYLHLDQVSTSHNYFNGKPSTLLTVIPVENKEFGDIVTVRFENPECKCLINDVITEFKLEIRDEDNAKINNNLPVSCVLEII